MLRILRSLFRAPCARRTCPLGVESLEERSLLSATPFNFHASLAALSKGEQKLASSLVTGARKALGTDLPVVEQSLNQALNLSSQLKQWLGPVTASLRGASLTGVSRLERTQSRLEKAGFTVDYLSSQPNEDGDLLRVHRDFTKELAPGKFKLGGSTSFEYLDNAVSGDLDGKLTASAESVTFHLEMGIDLVTRTVGRREVQVPSFFVVDTSSLSVVGLQAHGAGNAKLRIGSLAAYVSGTVDINLDAELTLNNLHDDHKLRLADFAKGSVITGDINGVIQLSDVNFTAQLPVLGDVTWSGNWTATIDHNVVTSDGSLTQPDYAGLLNQVAAVFSTDIDSFPLLNEVGGSLQKKLPVVGRSVADLLDLNDKFAWLGRGTPTVGQLLEQGISVDVSPETMAEKLDALMHGEEVELFHYTFADAGAWTTPRTLAVGNLGLPNGINAQLNVTLTPNVNYDYKIGFGLTSEGFYVDSDSFVTISGNVRGVLAGTVSAFGISGGQASGSLNATVNASAALVDPTPDDGKIFLTRSEQENVLDVIYNAVEANVNVGLIAHGEARVFGLKVWSRDWNLPELVNFHKEAGQA